MGYLIAASLLWSFSFGLIKQQLAGLDPFFIALIRLVLSLLIFAPFLRIRRLPLRLTGELMVVGAIQYGLMYMAYLYSFQFLAGHEVALFTIFTPLYVTLVNDLFRKRFQRFFWLTSLLAVMGTAAVIQAGNSVSGALKGVFVLQLSNLCFAFGQVRYKEIREKAKDLRDYRIFGLLYLGACLVALLPVCASASWGHIRLTGMQWGALLYLGLLPSGVAFFLWNVGATRVNAGTLAVLNNLKIPLAVIVAIVCFGEKPASTLWLIIGFLIIASAVFLNERHESAARQPVRGQTPCS